MEVKKEKRQCPSYPICYTLLIKKVKNINMHISKQGEIIVSANPYIPLHKIDLFVEKHIAWILDKQKKIKEREDKTKITKEYVYILGKKVKLVVVQGSFSAVSKQEGYLKVTLKEEEHLEGILQSFLDKMAQTLFNELAQRIYQMLQDYHLPFPQIVLRKMNSRWGSCIPSKGKITLNKKLIHYPISFIEYVILHEFVHFIQPNHSKAFYHIIQFYMPDYKQRIQLEH